jgi:ribosome maturation factor RimP
MIEKIVVKELAEDFLKSSDNYLVAIEIKPDNMIIVEIDNDKAVSIDDCVALSKYLESKLDRDVEDYALEVSSAGITQPFKVLRQYCKNIGNEVEVLAKSGIKCMGVLKEAGEKEFVLTVQKQIKPEGTKRKIIVEEDLTFCYEEIKHTKYIIKF